MEIRWFTKLIAEGHYKKVLQYRTLYDTYDYGSHHEDGNFPKIQKWSDWKDVPEVVDEKIS